MDEEDKPKPAPKPKAPRKPRRVALVHPDMKGQARPFENDLAPWFAAGWKRSAGNAD